MTRIRSHQELARILRKMYENAKRGQKVAMIHLFGIKYAEEIRGCDGSPAEIARLACGYPSYGVEISKGCVLADFVEITRGALSPAVQEGIDSGPSEKTVLSIKEEVEARLRSDGRL